MAFAFPPLDALALLFPLGASLERSLALTRVVARPGARLLLCGVLTVEAPWWPGATRWSTLNTALDKAYQALHALAGPLRDQGFAVDVDVLCGEEDRPEAGLPVLVDGFDEEGHRRWAERLLEGGTPLLWPGAPPPREPRAVLVPQRLGPFRLPGPPDPLLRRVELRLELLEERLSGPEALPAAPGGLERLRAHVDQQRIDLIFLPLPPLGIAGRVVVARLLGAWHGSLPVPLWLAEGQGEFSAAIGELEAADLLVLDGLLHGRLLREGPLGGPVDAERVLALRAGEAPRVLTARQGKLRGEVISPGPLHLQIGAERAAATVLAHAGRVGLFDAAIPAPAALAARLDPDRAWWGVRLHPEQPFGELRAGLARAGLSGLLDADALLEDAPAEDRPEGGARVRLQRLARVLRARGVPVDVVIVEGESDGFLACAPEFPADAVLFRARVAAAWRPPSDPLRERARAAPSHARRLVLLLDNREARERQLALIAGATERVHLRTCLYHDDRCGRELADALVAAGARGVDVRVMADSLYSLHGSLGQQNPVLARLEAAPGVRLRVWSPVQAASLRELKGRDHGKQLIVDGRVAIVGGRNVGDPYLTGWEEVAVSASTPYRDVPWLDAAVEVEGAVVQAIDGSFRRVWRASGGGDFAVQEPPQRGEIPVRFVDHLGLEDCYTLDAYGALIDGAREQLTLVNTFPLHDELAARLLAARARGVRVRYLVGNVRPLYGAREPFPGGVWRELATQVIHGRLDALVAAGAEAYELTLQGIRGWDPALGPVWPHVHAKLLSVDGRRYTIGSANLDLTSAYWENECLLVVDSAAETARLDAALDTLIAGSQHIDPADPAWALLASRRAWLSRNWPDLLA